MAQYGMNNMPEEYISSYVESSLKDDNQRGQIRDSAMSRKIMAEIKGAVKVTDKEVTLEAFQKMFE
jgi:trigger factor